MRTRPGERRLFRTRKSKDGAEVGGYRFWFKGKRYNTGTADYDEALSKLALWLPRLRKGLSIGEGRTATVQDLLGLVEEDYKRKGRRTLDRLDSRLKRLQAQLGSIPAPLLTTERVERYIRELQEKGLKNATINRDLETLRRAFRLAMKRRPPLVQSELAIELLPQHNQRNADLTPEEYRALIDFLAERDRAVRLMTIIAYHIGWRAEPIRGLRKLQVDLEEMVIRPPGAQTDNKKVGAAPIYGDLERELRLALAFDEPTFPTAHGLCTEPASPLRPIATPGMTRGASSAARICAFTTCAAWRSRTCSRPGSTNPSSCTSSDTRRARASIATDGSEGGATRA